ncbi:MAG TPA: diadenylate cyclase CdaA [bacterium]|nr:diadenylate cyclase CdaA [bacterium]
MVNHIVNLLTNVRPQDIVDIALLTAVIYWLLNLIKGTRTIPILVGLTVLLGVYAMASFLQLDAIGWLMENLFSSAVVILVVLFQADIRNALARVGMTTMFREMSATAQRNLIDEVVQTAYALAKRRIGGTIVLENETGLRNYIERGKQIRAEPTMELMQSIFHTSSPLHDGAVIIDRKGELAAARCILPLSSSLVGSFSLGTRHRSALGLSEETDAAVVVISEERGQVSLAHVGHLKRDLDENELRAEITTILQGNEPTDALPEAHPKAQPARG